MEIHTKNDEISFLVLSELSESIAKASALIQTALNSDFLKNNTYYIQYNYLWALSDFIYTAQRLCEQLETLV